MLSEVQLRMTSNSENAPAQDQFDLDPYADKTEVTRGAVAMSHPLLNGLPRLDTQIGYSGISVNGTSGLKQDHVVEFGSGWHATPRPSMPEFYYRPTSFDLDRPNATVDQIAARVYVFAEREFAVEMERASPREGLFELGVFVNTALIRLNLRIWGEEKKYVIEIELIEGDPITFGEVYRALKKTIKIDTLST